MTRGDQQVPPTPGKASACRAANRPRIVWVALAVSACVPALAGRALAKPDGAREGIVSEVRIEGNVSIPNDQIRAKILSRAGQPLDSKKIETDLKSLNATKWFSSVQPYVEETPPDSHKFVLIFAVKESPILGEVEFRGRSKTTLGLYKISLKDIEETTGLKKGNRADATRTHLAVGQIQRLYAEKGYDMAEVRLLEGGNRGDTRVVIEIFEGPKHVVRGVDFEGATFVSKDVLKTKIASKPSLLGLNVVGGVFHRDTLEEDARKLREYYQGQGFFDVKLDAVTRSGATPGDTYITFNVSEGVQYRVRKILFEGNKKFSAAKLTQDLRMHSGQPMLDQLKEIDRKTLMNKYYEIGCITTQIAANPKLTDEHGVMDMVYEIAEGDPVFTGEIIVKGNDRTQDRVIRREANMAGLLPGELLDRNRLEIYKKRLSALGYFQNAPEQNKQINVQIGPPRKADKPYGDVILGDLNDVTTRMQDAGAGPDIPPAPAVPPRPAGPEGLAPFGAGNAFNPDPDVAPSVPPIAVPSPDGPPAPLPLAPPNGPRATAPVGAGQPPGMFPSIPGMNATDVGPDLTDAFRNRQYADVVTSIEEAPTGRFMLGVGASGSQGLSANVSIFEKNFNIFNPPRSFTEIVNGQAFRGGGQEFSAQAFVGTLINRFQVQVRDPYLFDLPIGGGMSGYVFNRIYPDWMENRGGGRFWLGRQFGTSTYADVAFRAEAINFYGYRTPAPADFLAATGTSNLFSLKPSLTFDNRNAPFLPNKGQYLQFSFEQGWGTYTFPKFEAEGRTYFTLGSRPDGSGPRTLELRGHFGVTGQDTPVYERFFAGYFGSLRGFQYRGVGPHVLGSNVGGRMEALGSVEYMFPLMANDSIRQVFFCDFGTVEPNYEFMHLRASVGTGLRVTIPALGPLPLAFDLGFPVVKAPGDRVQVFNFSVGVNY